jgi:nickel/cobalt exporter
MMAAFIVAVRGTSAQAILLGVAAAIGHTLIIWMLALTGLWLGDKLVLQKAEPWLMVLSGLLIVTLALRILWRIHIGNMVHTNGNHHHHDRHCGDRPHAHNHDHNYAHAGGHKHDAHAEEHAIDLEQRIAGRYITSLDVAWFGFTGGLLPCPAAFAVLLVCLQLKEINLGIAMVLAFSIGLAVTFVLVGLLAAWGTRTASAHWSGFERVSHRLPYVSAGIVLVVGLLIVGRGLLEIGGT